MAATFGKIVYSVLDILKERADDAYYTEEHIIFLASKMRSLLLERKYKNNRNTGYTPMSEENTQVICLDLLPEDMLPEGCAGAWLKSVQKVPDMLSAYAPKLTTMKDLLFTTVTFIPAERMPYVGYNKWLKNIVYAAKSADDHLYMSSSNPQFIFLEKVRLEGVFSNPEEAAKLSCEADENGGKCDILSVQFPLEDALIPSCIELIVQELIGSRYAPEDKDNDAKDGLGDAAVTSQKAATPVESSEPKQR